MRLLLVTTSISALIATSPAAAQTTIDGKQTTAIRTSTVKAGAPDNVRISASGSVTPTGGVAVTVDSNNTVANAGTIQITGANDATGILAQANVRGEISNAGKIIIDETYTPTDSDKDGDIDGPFAQGTGRFGIRTSGAFTGNIANAGEITVEGNDSAGIAIGGPLTGNFSHDGKTAVLGDRSTGVRLDGVTGNVTLGGSITAIGRDAVAARLDGDIAGALVVQGTLGSTGYRYTQVPASTTKLDGDDLLQGGPALLVAGNVSGGVLLSNAAGKAADVITYGSAPALQIGSATRAIAIGPVASTTPAAGLIVNGNVTASGLYSGVAATAVSIGGLGSGVAIANGMAIGGKVEASATGATSTAIRIGSGATTQDIRVSGTVGAASTGAGTQASAISIDAGASLPALRNTGTIRAVAGGDAIAIVDRSGTLAMIENSGSISATGATRNTAIDLTNNTSGVTIRQTAGTAAAAPAITGAIRLGSGNDLVEVAAGSIAGDVSFGGGSNRLTLGGASSFSGSAFFGGGADTLSIAGTARFSGTADFGGGADVLTIADKGVFNGGLLNAANLAVTVAPGGGTFASNGATTVGSLNLGAQSVLSVALDKANPAANLITVTGATTIGASSQLAIRVAGGTDITGRYVVLRSGSLTGVDNLALSATSVPFLYKGTLVKAVANEIAVDVARKAATELGFNRAQASAFDAIDTAIGSDAKVATAIRGLYDGAEFRASVDQMLPNFAGGVFEGVTLGSRMAARQLLEPAGRFPEEGAWGFWLTPVGWDASKDQRQTLSYDVRGWGVSGGIEHKTGAGNFGVSLAYLSGRDSEGVALNRVEHDQYELAGFWRGHWGGFAASVRGSAAWLGFDSVRRFNGVAGSEKIERTARADWNGMLYSGAASISYEQGLGDFSVRPVLSVDYYRLNEDAYREAGGGSAMDLTVRERTSDELAMTASLAAGYSIGGRHSYDQWTRLEVEGGWREHLSGAVGSTTASFGSGKPFTLDPDARDGGWVGKVRAITGTTEVRLSGEASAEKRLGDVALAVRAALQFAF